VISPALETILMSPPFGMPQADKERQLLPVLKELTRHHRESCEAYRRITDLAFPGFARAATLEDIPYLPITLFKFRHLRSVAPQDVRVTVTSSGTSGSRKSRVDLDAETAKLSSRALSLIIGSVTQGRRLPMLIIDAPSSIKSGGGMGARAAAILGLMPYGRDHVFALRDDMSLDEAAMTAFLKKHAGEDILIYGFTFLIWQYFVNACEKNKYDLSRGILLHSGGWKKLTNLAVDNAAFKAQLKQAANLDRVMNFYGMAELPGTIFLENEDGLLYPPHFADVLIRDPVSLEIQPQGKPGLIHILSAIPHSYPGHSLLTEDIGVIENVDSGLSGRYGNALRILGRAPRAEMRGCSDVLGEAV
jgi:hypothetical protein